jgi:hypothetical protein
VFRPETLEQVLRDVGLAVVATTFGAGTYGWMVSLQNACRYGKGLTRPLAGVFDPFRWSGVPMAAAFTVFDTARAMFGCRTSSMLAVARKTAG